MRDFPVETSPLVKAHRSKPGVVEKWDLYVRGFELNSHRLLRAQRPDRAARALRGTGQGRARRRRRRRATSTRTSSRRSAWACHRPAAWAWSIDRLLIALTGATIRETITFPLVKPLNG